MSEGYHVRMPSAQELILLSQPYSLKPWIVALSVQGRYRHAGDGLLLALHQGKARPNPGDAGEKETLDQIKRNVNNGSNDP
jgi:hypothetical protein